jgi:hypothetical protein
MFAFFNRQMFDKSNEHAFIIKQFIKIIHAGTKNDKVYPGFLYVENVWITSFLTFLYLSS